MFRPNNRQASMVNLDAFEARGGHYLIIYIELLRHAHQAAKSALVSVDDLEEVWERAITVARVEHPNRRVSGHRQVHSHLP